MCTSAVTVSMSFLELFCRLLSAEEHKRNPFQISVKKAQVLKKKTLLPSAPESPANVSFKLLANFCIRFHMHNCNLWEFPSDCKTGDLLQKLSSPWLLSRSSLDTSNLFESKSACFRSTCPRLCFPELILAAFL